MMPLQSDAKVSSAGPAACGLDVAREFTGGEEALAGSRPSATAGGAAMRLNCASAPLPLPLEGRSKAHSAP